MFHLQIYTQNQFHISAYTYRKLIIFHLQEADEFTHLLLQGWLLDFNPGTIISVLGNYDARPVSRAHALYDLNVYCRSVQLIAVKGVLPAKRRSISTRDFPSVSGSRK